MQPSPNGARRIVSNLSSCYTSCINELPLSQLEGGEPSADKWLVLDRALEYVESFEKEIEQEFAGIDPQQVRSPLLNHVGIVDINRGIAQLSEQVRQEMRYVFQEIGSFSVYSMRLELEEQVFAKMGIPRRAFINHTPHQNNSKFEQGSFATLQNEFFPVADGSLLHELANTTLWRRTLGIPQLGWKDNYPLENIHSRGAHQLFVATNMARVLQGLYDISPAALVRRLRQDFSDEEFYKEYMSDEEVALLAADLAVVVGMTHDIYTPAGGDMMKHIMDMDEEKDASKLLNENNSSVEEFMATLERRGLNADHIKFVIGCIQGDSSSLVGEMIHSETGDILEQDRLAYTVQDLFSAGILGPAVASELFDEHSLQSQEQKLVTAWNTAAEVLADGTLYAVGRTAMGSSCASLSLLDISNDYILDGNLELTCTRPDKLLWLAAFRAMMSAEFYQGAKLRGQEYELSVVLKSLKESGKARDVLTSTNLSQITNHELKLQLETLNDQQLTDLLSDMDKLIYSHMYNSEIMPSSEIPDDAWFVLPMSIKPGLDTRVRDGNETIPLGMYMSRHPEAIAAQLLIGTIEKYHGKMRVIHKMADTSKLKILC